MPGASYSALSGMRSRLEELDRLAVDLANVGTAGYKTERTARETAQRDQFSSMLESAVDVNDAVKKIDFTQGTIATTGRDLDVAIDGRGFFVIDTPRGQRYTRNGSFTRGVDGTLTTAEGFPVVGEGGPIKVGKGAISVDEKGTVRVGNVQAGTLSIVDAKDEDFMRESGARFSLKSGVTAEPIDTHVVAGALEGSNVSLVDRMAALTEVSRGFEALQRGISVLFNDVDARAISELGRR